MEIERKEWQIAQFAGVEIETNFLKFILILSDSIIINLIIHNDLNVVKFSGEILL